MKCPAGGDCFDVGCLHKGDCDGPAYASGGIVSGTPALIGERAGETILPAPAAQRARLTAVENGRSR